MESVAGQRVSFHSPLLRKAANLGLSVPNDLERLAVVRGLRYYDVRNEGDELRQRPELQIPLVDSAYAENAVALLSPELDQFPDRLLRQRMASALLSHHDVNAENLSELAEQEHCAAMVRWIASAETTSSQRKISGRSCWPACRSLKSRKKHRIRRG